MTSTWDIIAEQYVPLSFSYHCLIEPHSYQLRTNACVGRYSIYSIRL